MKTDGSRKPNVIISFFTGDRIGDDSRSVIRLGSTIPVGNDERTGMIPGGHGGPINNDA